LSVDFYNNSWEILPIFLESCPNLKSLVVVRIVYIKLVYFLWYKCKWGKYIMTQTWMYFQGSITSPKRRTSVLSGPRRLLSSLEYVEIESPLTGEVFEMKLVSYLLENSPILKKLTINLDDSSRKKAECELLTIPRRSTSCQVVVL